MPRRLSHTIYVGNLPGDIRESEVEDLFYKYGPIVEIDLKIPPRPPGFAFVEFEDVRDAEDAVHGRNRYDFDGHRLRVEFAHGGRSSSDTYSSYGGSSYRGGGAPKHTDYRVMVTGLPSSASWQDLKDHMRRAGEVCFSDVYKDRRYGGMVGVVDYASYDDMKRAVRKLDDTEFRNAFSRAYIRVKEYNSSPDNRSRSRSYSSERSYSRSRSYSISPKRRSYRSYSRSPSVSKSRSPSRSLSRSRSRSRSPVKRSLSRSRSRSRSRSSRSHSPAARSDRSRSVSEERY